MDIIIDGMLLSEVFANDIECWPVTNVKILFSGYFIDVDIKIHCIKKDEYEDKEEEEEEEEEKEEEKEENILVDLMNTEITIKSNNCLDYAVFCNLITNGPYLNYSTELLIEEKIKGYVIEIFAGDIMHAIIDDIQNDYVYKLFGNILPYEICDKIGKMIKW